MEPHLRHCCSVWGCTGLTEINQLQKLQNRAARIIANSSFDAPGRPLIQGMRWKTVHELITGESKTMVVKSLNKFAQQYLCDLFTRNSLCSSYSLGNAGTDFRLLKKGHQMARDAFHIKVQHYGMACQPSLCRQPPCIVLRKQSKTVFFD